MMVSEGGVVIYNPRAGRGRAGALIAAAKSQLGGAWEWRPTLRAGHALALAREAAQTAPVVVAFGGDGTVGDVARGIVGTEAALGILPVGTGNDVARNLKLSLELREACATLLNGRVRRIDMGLINQTAFLNNAGLGFDARVMQTMNTGIRFARGQTAFVLATLKMLPGFKPFRLMIEADGHEARTLSAMMVSVLNGPLYGAGMRAAPTALMDDGVLDVMVIRALPKARLIALFPKVIAGQHVGHPAVELFQTRRLSLQTVPPQPLNIDGDVSGLTPAEISVQHQALKVVAP